MAVSFTKLGLSKNNDIKTFTWNEQDIEVKQYLPIQEKLSLITRVLDSCQDANNFVNTGKRQLFLSLETLFAYSNIKFTDKQKEDPAKLYDLLVGSGFMDQFLTHMNDEEWDTLMRWCVDTTEHFYKYRNSVYGILDAISTDYSNLELDADKIKNAMANPEQIGFLKDVLTKLG